MGWLRALILRAVIRAIRDGDEETRKEVTNAIMSAIKLEGIKIGGYKVLEENGAFTIKKA